MNYGWVKHFADGTKEFGSDQAVRMKRASWSQGRLTGMIGAEVIHGNKRIAIFTPGEFWQSDDYDVRIFESTPSLAIRRLQYKIQPEDSLRAEWLENSLVLRPGIGFYALPEKVGKWMTLELNIETGEIDFSIQENRI